MTRQAQAQAQIQTQIQDPSCERDDLIINDITLSHTAQILSQKVNITYPTPL